MGMVSPALVSATHWKKNLNTEVIQLATHKVDYSLPEDSTTKADLV